MGYDQHVALGRLGLRFADNRRVPVPANMLNQAV